MASSGEAKVVQSGGIHCIAAISSLVAARFPPIRRLPRPRLVTVDAEPGERLSELLATHDGA
jgi:hypothetical protein